MYTSVLLCALFAAHEEMIVVPPPSNWHDDYTAALQMGVRDKKPVAIIVGEGRGGWQDVSKAGELDKDVKDLLQKNYVCLFVDTNTKAGRKLAGSLAVDSGPALIIGDRTGTNQAFRYAGTLTTAQLKRTLKRFADADDVASETETRVSAPPQAAPRYSPPQWQPQMFMGGGMGGC